MKARDCVRRYLVIPAVVLLNLQFLSGCSDGAESAEFLSEQSCSPEEVILSESPPAPAAACNVPPTPISSLIELQFSQQISEQELRRAELLDPAKLTVLTCGTGSPVPSARAQSCLAVFVNGKFLLFDAGDGAQESMEDLNLPVTDIDAIFITHFHSDHVADLGEVISRTWILGRTEPVPVFGGFGVKYIVDAFNAVYAADETYRIAHHGEEVFPTGLLASPSTILNIGPEGRVVYEEDGVSVLAFRVDHSPVGEALGYRVEYAGKAVGVSGDTIDTAGLRALAANADVLVTDAMNKSLVEDTECAFGRIPENRLEKIFRDIRSYHIDVTEVAEVARDAEVANLVMTHLVPSIDNPAQLDLAFRQPAAAIYSGNLIIAEDGTELVIPVL